MDFDAAFTAALVVFGTNSRFVLRFVEITPARLPRQKQKVQRGRCMGNVDCPKNPCINTNDTEAAGPVGKTSPKHSG